MQPHEEEALVVMARTGDVEAFSALVREHHVAIRRYLTSLLRDPAVADDLAQDVFVAALRDLHAYEGRTRFVGWLFGIARHRAKMYLRSESRRAVRANNLGFALLLDAHVRDLDPLAHEEELAALETCLNKIPSHAAELVREHYYAATPLVDIARRTGKKEGSVRVALLRARVWLRSCIDMRLSSATTKATRQQA